MNFPKKKYSIILLLLISLSTIGQTRKQLETQRKKAKSEIKKLNALLFETKKKEKNALDDLKDINQRIVARQHLIRTISLENKALVHEIQVNKKKQNTLIKKLNNLKEDYADMIFKSYKSKSQQSRIMFLLSSKNFHQAYKRLQYMNQYTSYRKKQGEAITIQAKEVAQVTDSLLYLKQVKDTLLVVEKEQKQKIEADKNTQEKIVSNIKKKERKYKKDLQNKIREEKRIAGKIDKIIRDAIVRSNKKRKKGTKKSTGFILTPEAKALAARFEQNKGKLPWPVKKGLITRKFGVQKHPTISGITINSTGLHIATEQGAKATSIFNGNVLSVQLVSEGKKSVLVQHGNYITAYNNLENVYVKKGERVITGQQLGQIFTNKVTGKTTLVFVLYRNTKRLNPSSWILK